MRVLALHVLPALHLQPHHSPTTKKKQAVLVRALGFSWPRLLVFSGGFSWPVPSCIFLLDYPMDYCNGLSNRGTEWADIIQNVEI